MSENLSQLGSKSEKIAELKQRREQLEETLYSGVQFVRHGDKQVGNRSVEELRKALAMLDKQIEELEGHGSPRIFYIDARRGY
ncbi:phage head-tail joining protein [Bartonella sp. cb54]|uniref:phage head-tail joining protein n=1 Tax=Bartonella sp. cb54 TaxID=3385560 RepID=UPI0039A5FDD3